MTLVREYCFKRIKRIILESKNIKIKFMYFLASYSLLKHIIALDDSSIKQKIFLSLLWYFLMLWNVHCAIFQHQFLFSNDKLIPLQNLEKILQQLPYFYTLISICTSSIFFSNVFKTLITFHKICEAKKYLFIFYKNDFCPDANFRLYPEFHLLRW